MKNRAYHFGIKMSPYETLFGCKIIGLSTSNLPYDVISTIENKEQLAKLITEQPKEINSNVENDISNTEQLLITTIRVTKKLNNENANVMRTRAKENLENQVKKIMA